MALWIIAIVVPVVLLFVLIYLCCHCYIIKESEVVVIERFGRFHRIFESGVNFTAPFIDSPRPFNWVETSLDAVYGSFLDVPRLSYRIDCRETLYRIQPAAYYTRDGLLVDVQAVMYLKIDNIKKAIYEVDDLHGAIYAAVQTQLKEALGQMTFHEALESQEFVNQYMLSSFANLFHKWGIAVFRCELTSIAPAQSSHTTAIMKSQMIAERQRRGEYIKSEGTKQSQIIRADGEKRVAQIMGLAENECISKISEGEASATVQLATAEKTSLDAIMDVTIQDNVTLTHFWNTRGYLDFFENLMGQTSSKSLYLPFESMGFSGVLQNVNEVFGFDFKKSSQKTSRDYEEKKTR